MKIKSTDLILWLNSLKLPLGERAQAIFSKDALRLYEALTCQGFFNELLMTKEGPNGHVELVKVR